MVATIMTVYVLHDAQALRGFTNGKGRGNGGGNSIPCLYYDRKDKGHAAETVFAPLGCECALIGQKCGPDNSQCIGPNGERKSNGAENRKKGTCGCQSGFSTNYNNNKCTAPSAACLLVASTSSITVGNCVPAFGTISGITITVIK